MNINPLRDGILRAVRRAEVPALLFAEDVSVHLGIPADDARHAMRRGELGPWFTIQGRPAVLRDTLREHMKLCSSQAHTTDRELLRRGERGDSEEARDAS